MFNQGYDDKEMGLLFGWKPHTVIERRNEYDLRGLEDLKKQVVQKAEIYKTRKELEDENKDIIENQRKEIEELKKQLQNYRKEFLEKQIEDETKLEEKIKKEIREELLGIDIEKIKKEIEEDMRKDN